MSANHLPQLVLELLKLLFFPLKYISFKPPVIYSEAFLNLAEDLIIRQPLKTKSPVQLCQLEPARAS